jgi:hypothetical protein
MLGRTRRVSLTAAAAAVLVLPLVPAAAAPPVAGADYQGHVSGGGTQTNRVSFTVSKNGTSVRTMRIGPFPGDSCGSGGDRPAQSSRPAAIRHGRFTAHIVYRDGDRVVSRATVTGKFLKGGKAAGAAEFHPAGAPECNQTMPFKAHAE